MDRRFQDNLSLNKFAKDPPGIYRWSLVGQALRESLNELGGQKKVDPFIENHILKVFDYRMTEALSRIAQQDVRKEAVVQFNGKGQDKHSFIDGSWEMHLNSVVIGSNSSKPVLIKKAKIMADNWSDKSVEQRKILRSLGAGCKMGRKMKNTTNN